MKSLIILCLFLGSSYGKATAQETLHEPKPTVIFFHTDWCAYCKIQQKQIEKDSTLNAILKKDYRFINFNAEGHEEIAFNNKVYKPKQNSTHGFTKVFFPQNRQIAYPAWIILDKNNMVVFNHEGLIKADDLIGLLRTDWSKFSKR